MGFLEKIITDFELHSVGGIKDCFKNGISPNEQVKGKPLIYSLINMYSRGPLFKSCVRAFVEHGVEFDDKVLLAVLLDDALMLERLIDNDPDAIQNKYTLECTFTPLLEASLLHICAEYNHVSCAKFLLDKGVDINIKAGYDENGFGGQTPIFHAVNQHNNFSMEVLTLLLASYPDLSITVKGLIWGRGYEWETYIPSVNPISYAMMGMLRQFQRTEKQIYEVVSLLMKAKYWLDYFPINVPNKYLNN